MRKAKLTGVNKAANGYQYWKLVIGPLLSHCENKEYKNNFTREVAEL